MREWLMKKLERAPTLYTRGGSTKLADHLFDGTPVLTVWPISNGFLLVGGSDGMRLNHLPSITYVKDISEIGEQIATMRARLAIGVPNTVDTRSFRPV
jgi:hypothetical protein